MQGIPDMGDGVVCVWDGNGSINVHIPVVGDVRHWTFWTVSDCAVLRNQTVKRDLERIEGMMMQ